MMHYQTITGDTLTNLNAKVNQFLNTHHGFVPIASAQYTNTAEGWIQTVAHRELWNEVVIEEVEPIKFEYSGDFVIPKGPTCKDGDE